MAIEVNRLYLSSKNPQSNAIILSMFDTRKCSTLDPSSCQISAAFSPSFSITTRAKFGLSLIVASGNPSIVFRKLHLMSKPTARSTTDRVSLTSGFVTNFTEMWSDAVLGDESTLPLSSTFSFATM